MERPQDTPASELDDPVPILGSWPRVYAAVLANAVLIMILIAVFARWAF